MIEYDRRYFDKREEKIIDTLLQVLEPMIPNATVELFYESIRIVQAYEDDRLVVGFKILHEEKKVELNCIIIPLKVKPKGIGDRIISAFLEVDKEFDYSFYITNIVTHKWYEKLLKSGAEQYGENGLYIDSIKWKPVEQNWLK